MLVKGAPGDGNGVEFHTEIRDFIKTLYSRSYNFWLTTLVKCIHLLQADVIIMSKQRF